ncbi:hypothetical protein BBW65_04740 [Helicobacter enhydrae]|uniref:Rod shape-determining protein MreC beta-barrel core domain-containing protein n=1 Tax=Helicobacter enhydrae TaxID=222136 RepID=A0A1B1U5X0_9HELI|nr:rod shape-determining protein MreC [Helicobacter enhydrae]ANV98148.1 hypothetical protein BBW65_04740 [Helicobacter enhydrae]
MKIKPLIAFVLFLIVCFIFFKIDRLLKDGVLMMGEQVKAEFLDFQAQIKQKYQEHIDQASRIRELVKYQQESESLRLQNLELQQQILEYANFNKMLKPNFASIFPARIDSYVELGNFKRVWIEASPLGNAKFYGLIADNQVVGIAKKDENDRIIGFLNGDPQCSYGVMIGDEGIQGIVKANGNQKAWVDFIPMGSLIKVGDKVLTSGKDGIFFKGAFVGTITQVIKNSGYLSAELDLSYDVKSRFLWLIAQQER